jgi:hypothetical protein
VSEPQQERKEPIRGRVARIISTRELALNIGSEHGVKVGMKFDVMDPKGQDIEDPDQPGKILGSLDRSKKRVEVVEVKERLSLARTRSYHVNVGGTGGFIGRDLQAWSQMMLPEKWVTRYETLRATDEEGHEIDERESVAKEGDPVVEVVEEEKKPPVPKTAAKP